MSIAVDEADAVAGDILARRNALLLGLAQALAGGNAATLFATAAITGSLIAPTPSLATMPITLFVVGMACGTLPNGWIARHYGRRASFLFGASFGVLCGLICSAAVILASFPLYLAGTFCGGVYASVAQSFRFAAADTASPAFRPKAISWVMAGGVAAGVLGPQVVTWTMNLWEPYLFAATYFAQALIAFVAMGVLMFVRIPRPVFDPSSAGGRPLGAIVRTPKFIVAAACGVVSYTLMNLVMTAAPLAMKLCGHAVSDSNLAIQWHVMAMYGPSFFTGSLIVRFGSARVVSAGLLLTALAAVVAIAGITVAHFWIALILLGVGWNFGFVGASAMVTETHAPQERNKVQAFNDFLVFGTMALGSLMSGHLLTQFGWEIVNAVVFPPVLAGLGLLVWRAVTTPAREPGIS